LVVHARGLQNGGVFTPEARDVLREDLLSMASSDDRIVGGAVLGSLARGDGDEWSDLDIMFAVREDLSEIDVLDDWTTRIGRDLGATKLFDLSSGAAVYRVFLLRNSLELDLSMTPAPEFRPTGPSFSLLFGEAATASVKPDMSIQELFGYAVHHAFHARACIERRRSWQAEYWISALRDHVLHMACRRRGLDGNYGRDFDELPPDVLVPGDGALVRSLEAEELRRALSEAVSLLLRESAEVETVDELKPQLRQLTQAQDLGA
jgi:hypothetical protein